jgi:Thioredoxin like C-terminal domain
LYQLVRQTGAVADHIFTIEFEDPGVQAFSFTFGWTGQWEGIMIMKTDNDSNWMTRRTLMITGGLTVAAIALKHRKAIASVEAKDAVPKEVKIAQFSDRGKEEILSP